MKVYEVGGAVRDSLLGKAVTERDWVVVGATPGQMLELGYRQVGKDFPVFLHPQSAEEYALARTERKTAPGHTGFEISASPDVTLEEDLLRRDLTINAIAREADGRLIDPYGGQADLEKRQLRHVSVAFSEDPLRVLRVARFAAKLAAFGFEVAPETGELMAKIADSGELQSLSPSRIWQETEKALSTDRPDIFVSVLRDCGALRQVLPEVDRLFGVPQPPRWHPEIDTGVHTLMALKLAASLSDSAAMRFAVLTHDLGKGTTPAEILPSHHGHGERSAALIRELGERLPVPRRFLELAGQVALHHGNVHRAEQLKPGTVLKLIVSVDGLRRPDRFKDFLDACEADARGRLGLEDVPYTSATILRRARDAAASASDASAHVAAGLEGEAVGKAIRREQLRAIEGVLG